MTHIQTFIKKREKEFDEKFHVGNLSGCIKENPKTIKSFHRQSLHSLLEMMRVEIDNLIMVRTPETPTEKVCEKCGYPNDHRICMCSRNDVLINLRMFLDAKDN